VLDEVAIPNMAPEAMLNGISVFGISVLESANESGSTCKNNGRVVIM